MEKFIKIYDNIFSSEYLNYLENLILHQQKIPFESVSNIASPNSPIKSPGLSFSFHSEGEQNNSFIKYEFFKILYSLSNKINCNVKYIYEGRIFIHLPSPNPGPDDIHIDINAPHWVCLFYVNDSDGDTILFKEDKKTEIQRVTPKKGRVVFFDGSIPHCSSRPSLNTRAIINIDFLGEFFGNKK